MPEITKPTQLTEDAVREIEARFQKADAAVDYDAEREVVASLNDIPKLVRDLRAMRAALDEFELHRPGIVEAIKAAEARVDELESENAALREQLAQVTSEPLNATIDLLEQRRRSLGQEAIPEYARTINFLQALINEGKKVYPPLHAAGE